MFETILHGTINLYPKLQNAIQFRLNKINKTK